MLSCFEFILRIPLTFQQNEKSDSAAVLQINYFDSTPTIAVGDLVDSTFLSCLVDILKTPNPDLQRKAASILEFVVVIKPSMEKLPSADIASGLEAVFRQKSLLGMRNNRIS